MDINTILELMKKYNDCLECGNNRIGNGEGSLIVGTEFLLENVNVVGQ